MTGHVSIIGCTVLRHCTKDGQKITRGNDTLVNQIMRFSAINFGSQHYIEGSHDNNLYFF